MVLPTLIILATALAVLVVILIVLVRKSEPSAIAPAWVGYAVVGFVLLVGIVTLVGVPYLVTASETAPGN